MSYNYDKLRGLIREFFSTQQNYANALGISLTTLQSRLRSETEFTQNEIIKSRKLLHLQSAEESDKVFFTLK